MKEGLTPEAMKQIGAGVNEIIDERLEAINTLIEGVKSEQLELKDKDGNPILGAIQDELKAFGEELQEVKSFAQTNGFAAFEAPEVKSFGQQIIEHESFNTGEFKIDGFGLAGLLQKDITSLDDCGLPLGVTRQPTQVKPMMTPKLGLVDCITIGRTNAVAHRNVVECGYAPLYAKIVAEDSTVSEIVLEAIPGTAGFIIGHEVKICGFDTVVTAINTATHTLTVDPPLPEAPAVKESTVDKCTTKVYPSVQAKYSGATPEKMLKPQSDITFKNVSSTAKKIARWICVSDEAFKAIPRLQNYINMRLRHFMRLTLEWHLAYGNGNDDQLNGFFNIEGRQIRNWSDGDSGDNKLDALKNACTLLEVSGFDGNIKIILNPYDYDELLKMKDSMGRYLANSPFEDCEEMRLWCKPVVTSSCLKRGQAIVANLDMAMSFFECVGDEISGTRISSENGYNFIENTRTILTEMRLIQECCYPEAIVQVNFDTCPPEAEKPAMEEGGETEGKAADGSTQEILDRLNALEAENAALKAAATATKSGAAAFEAASGGETDPSQLSPKSGTDSESAAQ